MPREYQTTMTAETSESSEGFDDSALDQAMESNPDTGKTQETNETQAETPTQEPQPQTTPEQKPVQQEAVQEQQTTNRGEQFLKGKAREHWKALEEKSKGYENQVKELQAKVQEYEQMIQQAQQNGNIPEDLQKELADHRQWRAMLDYQNTPEFKERFDTAIASNEDQLLSLLAEHGLPEETMNAIKQNGSDSIPRQWWSENVLNILDKTDRIAARQIENHLLQTMNLKKERQTAMKDSQQRLQEHVQKQHQAYEEYNKQYIETEKTVIDEFVADFPDAKFKEVPPNATPEERAAIEAHNKEWQTYLDRDGQMLEALQTGDPVVLTQMRLLANSAFYFRDQLAKHVAQSQRAEARVAELEKQLNGIRGASSARSGSAPKQVSNAQPDYFGMNHEDAVEAGLKAMGI